MSKAPDLIKVLTPSLPTVDKIFPYLRQIDASHHYSNSGPLVNELEQRMATFFKVPSFCVVAVDNATNGLIGSLKTNLSVTGEWFVPSWTFVATPLAALHSGVDFKFCDVDSDLRAAAPSDCKNLIDVLPFGARERSYDQFKSLENLVIDGAASLQNLENYLFPTFPTALVISLHATKMFGAGEGGFVVFNSEDWANNFRLWTKFGMGKNRIPQLPGLNSKMSEYSAAVALASLDDFLETRNRWSLLNNKAREISLQNSFSYLEPLSSETPSVYWNLEIPNIDEVKTVVDILARRGIETRKWWPIAAHTMEFFSSISKTYSTCEQSTYRAQSTLGLPLHLLLTDSDFNRISEGLSEVSTILKG